eukprot:GHVT01010212.1.p2 GENE.GHVT01010212.1~~GHVT01010212.1.p2  ORF type:complete len:126 (+),score=28.09 GHVT01010212.1:601-978(+)
MLASVPPRVSISFSVLFRNAIKQFSFLLLLSVLPGPSLLGLGRVPWGSVPQAPSGTWADARRSRASAAAAEASQNERDQAALAARSRWMERWAGETQEGAQRLAPRSPHGKPNAATHTQSATGNY